MKNNLLLLSLLTLFLLNNFTFESYCEPINTDTNINNSNYKKLEDLKKELKEERKLIDQQRFEEIKLKELEKKKNEEENEPLKNNNENPQKEKMKKNENESIPSLIVRLRGKHSTKYLCSYNFIQKNENTQEVKSNTIIDSYTSLLKKPSLKVRPGEVINFEFSEIPQEIVAYIWEDNPKKIELKRSSMKVPKVDKKIVIAIEGKYKNGEIKYAIVLDVRN